MKALSDSYMGKGWRKAVLSNWGTNCAVCGSAEGVQCHHIIKRSRVLTRWNWRNGLPLCFKCHRGVHDGDIKIIQRVHQLAPVEYLHHFTQKTSAQYFTENGTTKAEWFKRMDKENTLKYMEDYR